VIVLDTHVWVWWLSDPQKLPTRARRTVTEAAGDQAVYISSISAWEIALLAARGRLTFTMDAQDWIAKSEALPFLHFVPVDNSIAVRSARLAEPFHNDPADRIIVATAITMGVPVVTSDAKIGKYPHVKAIWK
jgi:PIN domain nuclease of toxin-antitoxin system